MDEWVQCAHVAGGFLEKVTRLGRYLASKTVWILVTGSFAGSLRSGVRSLRDGACAPSCSDALKKQLRDGASSIFSLQFAPQRSALRFRGAYTELAPPRRRATIRSVTERALRQLYGQIQPAPQKERAPPRRATFSRSALLSRSVSLQNLQAPLRDGARSVTERRPRSAERATSAIHPDGTSSMAGFSKSSV